MLLLYFSLRTIVDARCVSKKNVFFSENPCCDPTRNKIKQNDNSRNNQYFVADETTEKSNVTFHNEENELNTISLKSLSYKFCSMHMVSEVSFEFSKASVVVHNVIVCCSLHYFLSQLLIKDLKRNFFSFEIND